MVGAEFSDIRFVPNGPLYLGVSKAGKWNLKHGMLPKRNRFIRLCTELDAARGMKATKGAGHFVIEIDAVRMAGDGLEFHILDDGFVASGEISSKYMSRHVAKLQGR